MMSEADLEHGMELAAIAGQLSAAGDVVAAIGMPVLADFLADKGEDLQEIAVDTILRSSATRLLGRIDGKDQRPAGRPGQSMKWKKAPPALQYRKRREARAEAIGEVGAELAVKGVVEMAAAQGMRQAAGDLAREGMGDVAVGAAGMGAAEALEQ